jgi:hypothetical protein
VGLCIELLVRTKQVETYRYLSFFPGFCPHHLLTAAGNLDLPPTIYGFLMTNWTGSITLDNEVAELLASLTARVTWFPPITGLDG